MPSETSGGDDAKTSPDPSRRIAKVRGPTQDRADAAHGQRGHVNGLVVRGGHPQVGCGHQRQRSVQVLGENMLNGLALLFP